MTEIGLNRAPFRSGRVPYLGRVWEIPARPCLGNKSRKSIQKTDTLCLIFLRLRFASRCESTTKASPGRRRLGKAKKIKAHRESLSGPQQRGCQCQDQRSRIEAILWILRTGSPWRDLPEQFGAWQSVYDRFRAWSKNGLWNAILQALSAAERDDEAVMIDSTAMRVYAHGANRAGGQEA